MSSTWYAETYTRQSHAGHLKHQQQQVEAIMELAEAPDEDEDARHNKSSVEMLKARWVVAGHTSGFRTLTG
jgi:hypothetical protein